MLTIEHNYRHVGYYTLSEARADRIPQYHINFGIQSFWAFIGQFNPTFIKVMFTMFFYGVIGVGARKGFINNL